MEELSQVKKHQLGLGPADIEGALAIPRRIQGLGIAGAAGLLALVYRREGTSPIPVHSAEAGHHLNRRWPTVVVRSRVTALLLQVKE